MSFPDQGARPAGCGREATHEPVYDASCVRADPAQGCGHDAGLAEQRDEPQTRCQTMQPVVQVDPERALFAQRDGSRLATLTSATAARRPGLRSSRRRRPRCVAPQTRWGSGTRRRAAADPHTPREPGCTGGTGWVKPPVAATNARAGEHGTVCELRLGVVAAAAHHLGVLGVRTGTFEVVRVGTEVGDCFVPGQVAGRRCRATAGRRGCRTGAAGPPLSRRPAAWGWVRTPRR